MRCLSDEHWRYFIGDDGRKNGERFECLVLHLLEARYGKNTWLQTKKSWDGSKDFYYYNRQKRMWAECKNYTSAISIDVLSPTLIMAQICDVDDVLFFSYSHIVPQAKTKFMLYAERTNKNVFFYDDEALEDLILEYRDSVFPVFFSHLTSVTFDLHLLEPWVQHTVVSAPIYHNRVMTDSIRMKTDFPDSINLFAVWGVYVLICNRCREPVAINLSLHESTSSIYQFDIITDEYYESGKTITLKPFESITEKILFRVVKYTPTVTIPKITVKSVHDQKEIYCVGFKEIRCNWLGKTPLVGKSYRDVREQLSNEFINRERFLGVCFWGTSGNGKSRMLEECMQLALRYNYSVFHFNAQRNPANHKTFTILKEIIFALYNIPDTEIIDFIDSNDSQLGNLGINAPAFQMIYKFSKAETMDSLKYLIDQYADRIFEHMIAQRYVLAIDNFQFFDSAMIYFVRKLVDLMTNTNRYNPTILMTTINTDYLGANSDASEFFIQCKALQEFFFMVRLTGFITTNESLIFIKELFPANVSLHERELIKILKRTGNNPLSIFQTIEWLKDNKIIYYANDHFPSLNEIKFNQKIKTMPCSIEQLFKERWAFFVQTHREDAYLNIIALIHFFQGLDTYKQRILKIDLNAINEMIFSNFLTIDENDMVFFLHDLVERFFANNYRLIDRAAKYISHTNVDFLTVTQNSMLTIFSNNHLGIDKLYEIINNSMSFSIPRFQQYEYFSRLFDLIEYTAPRTKKNARFYSTITKLVLYIRDMLGSNKGLEFFDRFSFNLMKNTLSCYRSQHYPHFLFRYCEAYDHIGQANKAIELLAPYVDYLEKRKNVLSVPQLSILCEGYNRLHVYHSHLIDSPAFDSYCKDLLVKSFRINHLVDCPIMMFTNYSDLGHLFYNTQNNGYRVCFFWRKACEIFDKQNVKVKTLNYYRKRTQLYLIENDEFHALKMCQIGLDYCDNGQYAYERLHFRQWFSMARFCALIMDCDNLDPFVINKSISDAEEYLYLMNTPKSYKLIWLKAIYSYWQKQYRIMLDYWLQTLNILENTPYNKHKSFNIQCVEENIVYTLASIGKKKYYDICSQSNLLLPTRLQEQIHRLSDVDASKYLRKSCISLLHDRNGVINFPLI